MDGLSEAIDRMNKNAPAEHEEPDGEEGENEDAGEVEAVHHHKHGKKHSTHKIKSDGTAESDAHDEGEGGADCPFCGGTGKQ